MLVRVVAPGILHLAADIEDDLAVIGRDKFNKQAAGGPLRADQSHRIAIFSWDERSRGNLRLGIVMSSLMMSTPLRER